MPWLDQLEKGAYLETRYHLVLIHGEYSNSIANNWLYGNCHKEEWKKEGNDWSHWIVYDGINKGRSEMQKDFSRFDIIQSTYTENDFQNGDGYFADGKVWIFTGK